MRVGELRQLTWGDIERIETAFDADEKQIKLAHINVRPETSKVRRHRKIICRGEVSILKDSKKDKSSLVKMT